VEEPIPIIVNGAAGRGCSAADVAAIEKAFEEAGAKAQVWQARAPG